jgi:hypothetical protein
MKLIVYLYLLLKLTVCGTVIPPYLMFSWYDAQLASLTLPYKY